MDFDTMIFSIIMSLFVLIGMNIIYFIEVSVIFEFFFKMFFPKKIIKEFEEDRRIRINIKYKNHKKKWRKIYLINYLVYFVALFIFMIVFGDFMASSFAAFLIIIVSFGVFSKKETIAKNIVIKEINSEYNSENHKTNLLE